MLPLAETYCVKHLTKRNEDHFHWDISLFFRKTASNVMHFEENKFISKKQTEVVIENGFSLFFYVRVMQRMSTFCLVKRKNFFIFLCFALDRKKASGCDILHNRMPLFLLVLLLAQVTPTGEIPASGLPILMYYFALGFRPLEGTARRAASVLRHLLKKVVENFCSFGNLFRFVKIIH